MLAWLPALFKYTRPVITGGTWKWFLDRILQFPLRYRDCIVTRMHGNEWLSRVDRVMDWVKNGSCWQVSCRSLSLSPAEHQMHCMDIYQPRVIEYATKENKCFRTVIDTCTHWCFCLQSFLKKIRPLVDRCHQCWGNSVQVTWAW